MIHLVWRYVLLLLRLSYYTFFTKEGWQNNFDGRLDFTCPNNQAMYRVRSEQSRGHRDRRWEWSCRTVLTGSTKFLASGCQWSGVQNGYDLPVMFQCPADNVLTGVKSVHNNGKEDRLWEFRCCSAKDYKTHDCYLTNWINDWNGKMDHSVCSSTQVFTGAYSYHDTHKQ